MSLTVCAAFVRRGGLLCLTVFALSACTDGDPVAVEVEGTGPIVGSWDGVEWEGRGYAVLSQDTLHLRAHRRPTPGVYYDEYVVVSLPLNGPGEYAVPSGSAALWKITGGDAGYMPSAEGTVVLSAVDGSVRGSIDLEAGPLAGAVWTFTDGQFDFPVHDGWDDAPCLGCPP